MTDRPKVTLTDFEQRLAKYIGRERLRVNVEAGVRNQRMGPQDDEHISIIGAGGELAYCRMFNVCPDLTIGPRSGGHDVERLGLTVDVKSTPYANGKLLATIHKSEHRSDVYALMLADWPTYTFAGWTTAEKLFTDKNIRDLGHGPTYALEQGELTADDIRWG